MKIFKYIRSKFAPAHINIGLSIAFALLGLLVRIQLTNSLFYFFLVWNLFLAGIPFLITELLKRFHRLQIAKPLMVVSFLLWLLFLPNSPYIITDLIHLNNKHSYILWLDLFLIFVFALNGLLLGLLSMMEMSKILQEKLGRTTTKYILFNVCLLSGYGIYLGRFLRFNSWDIITQPITLLIKLLESIKDPKVWLFSLLFGGFIWILFIFFQSVGSSGTSQKLIKR
ncbi:DUF1361 domain-containing protein [Maribacter cobaltidurans]|uniref:DUF1361 domain-containing protein n=1 Tax=Maribacter cobaltidurans TaxID=1178778 RepID=A0A223V2Q5_9FLAO|nr:hypothetical protein CJ263_03100 [Maribacter cobaltidurans]